MAVELLVYWLVTNALAWGVVRLDERWMKEDMLERAWPSSSRDCAIVAFGPLCLFVHFFKTRAHFKSKRGLLGFLLGPLLGVTAIALVSVVGGLILDAVAWMFGLPAID